MTRCTAADASSKPDAGNNCRRRFFGIAKTQKTPGLAAQALQWISKLYKIESRIKAKTPDRKYAVRQAEAVPVLALFRQWLDANAIGLLIKALERLIRLITIGRAN